MDKPDFNVNYESVIFEGCDGSGNIIFRPKAMSALQWVKFWENIQTYDPLAESSAREKLKEALEQIKELECEIKDLEQQIYRLESEP